MCACVCVSDLAVVSLWCVVVSVCVCARVCGTWPKCANMVRLVVSLYARMHLSVCVYGSCLSLCVWVSKNFGMKLEICEETTQEGKKMMKKDEMSLIAFDSTAI